MEALAIINQADAALVEASGIIEILELRTKAKAVELVAVAEGLGDIAQHAKIFQLRAERKAGLWLTDNIHQGRPVKTSPDERIRLDDLHISYNQSSRWQQMAAVPDDIFHGWLDERMAKGHEITAGGLRMYAKNYLGGNVTTPGLAGVLALKPRDCSLSGFKIRCDGPIQRGHILNKSKAVGNPAAREYLAQDMNINPQCAAHNVGKLSDNRDARRIQLLQKIFKHGWSEVRMFYISVPWKIAKPEFQLERMLEK